MKILWLLLCVVLTGCGAKSKEDIAMELITENLKSTLPDFNKYESLNFGTMGTASLPYDETDQCKMNLKALKIYKDSLLILEKTISANITPSTTVDLKEKLKQLQDSSFAKNERNKAARQGYTPEKLFKITHAYLIKGSKDVKTESAFFLDEKLTKVVKVVKVY